MPAPTRDAAIADARFASDLDVARWASNARTQYDLCRARLAALRQWSAQLN
ncbi:MAG: hypothetical protein LBE06_12770 [Azoarcus sp.]|nr:hypothetical protein [Azoarcus sp.]